MNVLSLFDGMSCGRIALERAGIPVTNYFASEVDKYAIQVSKKNWPDIVQLGDVRYVEDFLLPEIDLLIGGSPCQGFSFAGKQLNFEDERSKLFFEFVRLLKDIRKYNPDVKFLLENVKMKKEYQDIISSYIGCEPVEINSALLSAQNRKRLYWTNIPVTQPQDKGIFLKDILEHDVLPVTLTERRTEEAKAIRKASMANGIDFSPRRAKELVPRSDNKSNCLTAHLSTKEHLVQLKGVIKNRGIYSDRDEKAMCLNASYYKGIDNHGQRTFIQVGKDRCEGISILENGIRPFRNDKSKSGLSEVGILHFEEAKTYTLTAAHAPNLYLSPEEVERVYGYYYRKLTPIECERLQTVPDNYTSAVSDSQRYKMLGNGWTVDVIAHIFKGLK